MLFGTYNLIACWVEEQLAQQMSQFRYIFINILCNIYIYIYKDIGCFKILWTNFNISLGIGTFALFILQRVCWKCLVEELKGLEVSKLVFTFSVHRLFHFYRRLYLAIEDHIVYIEQSIRCTGNNGNGANIQWRICRYVSSLRCGKWQFKGSCKNLHGKLSHRHVPVHQA